MTRQPPTYNPDDTLVACRAIVTECLPVAPLDLRPELLAELGARLVELGEWLVEPESYCPNWPGEPRRLESKPMAKKKSKATKKPPKAPKPEPSSGLTVLTPTQDGRCDCKVDDPETHDRIGFTRHGDHCMNRASVLVELPGGPPKRCCAFHYDETRALDNVRFPALGVVRSSGPLEVDIETGEMRRISSRSESTPDED